MGDKTEDLAESADAGENPADAEFSDVDEQLIIETVKPSRVPLLLSGLALVVAVLALLGVFLFDRPAEPLPVPEIDTTAIDALADTVAASERSVADLNRKLAEIADREAAATRQIQQFRRELENRLDLYESLPGRVDNVENAVASVQGISSGVRDTWLLAEAEYYMQIANAQLQLGGNPRLARLALLQADERVRQLGNPALTGVRRMLSNELRALEVIDQPDVEGISLTLASLAGVVETLPLRQEIVTESGEVEQAESELTGFDRAMQSFRNSVGNVVSVRRIDENVRPLIAPESAYFLRANLSLQLQAARLALLRAEKSVFQQSLDDASSWLAEYYDTDSAQVRSAQVTISEIRDSLFDISIPDISESLRLLRQFNALAAAPPPVIENEPVEDLLEPTGEVPDEAQPQR